MNCWVRESLLRVVVPASIEAGWKFVCVPLQMGHPVLAQPEPCADLGLGQSAALARGAQQLTKLGGGEQGLGDGGAHETSEIQIMKIYL